MLFISGGDAVIQFIFETVCSLSNDHTTLVDHHVLQLFALLLAKTLCLNVRHTDSLLQYQLWRNIYINFVLLAGRLLLLVVTTLIQQQLVCVVIFFLVNFIVLFLLFFKV